MATIQDLTKRILAFRDARDWKQFHNPKDLSLSLTLEAAELMEHFQWKSNEEIKEYIGSHKKEIGKELADVLYWVILIGHDLDIDPLQALTEKMNENEAKYPIEKAKGKHTKYNKF